MKPAAFIFEDETWCLKGGNWGCAYDLETEYEIGSVHGLHQLPDNY